MSRPIKQGLDYFPHDTDAMNDEKLEVMQLLYGNDGYAFYFKMLERIYRSASLTLDISDAETKLVMIRKCQVDEERFDKMVNTALRQGLFDIQTFEDTGEITSKGIHKRSELVLKKRESMRERYSSKVSDAETREETMPETRQRKGKESIEKKSIEEERKGKERHGDAVALTAAEYSSLISLYGPEPTKTYIDELNAYKLRTGKQYTSDFLAIKTWVVDRVKEQSEQKPQQPRDYKPANKNATKPMMQMHVEETTTRITEDEWKELNDLIAKLEAGDED